MNIPDVGFNHQLSANHEIQVIELQSIFERKDRLDHSPERPHRIGFYHLICIEQGTGKHQIDFDYHPFAAGDFIFVQRNRVTSFDLSPTLKGKVVLFTHEFVEQALSKMRLPALETTPDRFKLKPVFTPSAELGNRAKTLINEITTELTHPQANVAVAMHLFAALLMMLQRESVTEQHSPLSQEQQQRFNRFQNLLEEHFRHHHDADFYAKQLHCTYKTLNHICKLASGHTAKQTVDNFIMLEAKRQLMIDTVTTQHLAYDLGFEDASNFVKYFKRHAGVTPHQFKKQL